MNSVNLIGRLAGDVQLAFTTKGTLVVNINLAVDKGLSKSKKSEYEATGKRTADFLACRGYGATAKLMNTYLRKGSKIGISGKLMQDYIEVDGRYYQTMCVIIDSVEFLSKKDEADNDSNFEQSFAELEADFDSMY